MEYVGYVYTDKVSYASRNDPKLLEDIVNRSKEHAHKVVELINTL